MYPVIILMCVVGAYAANYGVIFDVWSLVVFAILGYLFTKFKLPATPFLIGFILGGDLEQYFVDALKGSGGDLSVFFTRGPICWVLWLLIIGSVVFAVVQNKSEKKSVLKQAAE